MALLEAKNLGISFGGLRDISVACAFRVFL